MVAIGLASRGTTVSVEEFARLLAYAKIRVGFGPEKQNNICKLLITNGLREFQKLGNLVK